jgi:hypothetical protein
MAVPIRLKKRKIETKPIATSRIAEPNIGSSLLKFMLYVPFREVFLAVMSSSLAYWETSIRARFKWVDVPFLCVGYRFFQLLGNDRFKSPQITCWTAFFLFFSPGLL